jgi:hypothetical protein
VLLAVGALAACGAARPDAATADAVTQEFYAAVAADQRAEACALLAPLTVEALEDESGTPCEDAILAGDVGEALLARADDAVDPSARVAGRQAQVTTASDVLFLTVSGGTWLITAAACDARPDRPYDCALEA